MFTGIVTSTAVVKNINSFSKGLEMVFELSSPLINTSLGDSISIDGVCSTIVDFSDNSFTIHYLPETLSKTTIGNWKVGTIVNLELSLQPNSRMGGHFVTGHVDTVGNVISFEQDGEFWILNVAFNPQFSHLLIPKGSITINGISLTVVDLTDEMFSCHLIPHTISNTNLSSLKSDVTSVNLEFDMMGKYLYRFKQQGVL